MSRVETAIKLLKRNFPSFIEEISTLFGETSVTVSASKIIEILSFLKNEPYLAFNFLSDLCGVDYVYGVSKLAGEYFVRNLPTKHFVVRTSGLYGVAGSSGKGGSFVETVIRLAKEGKPIRVVKDQVLTPTYTKDLAQKIQELVQTGTHGVYHITNSGQCSWYEFAAKIFELTSLKPDFGPTTTVEFGAKARRPIRFWRMTS